jgi:hypothetical protein
MKTAIFAISMVLLAGCASHSSTDYHRADYSSRKVKGFNGNELCEMDVVGAALEKTPSDKDIANALDRSADVQFKLGDSVLVIQSGQPVPDARMVSEVNKHYRAIPFSGIRSDWARHNPDDREDHYSKSLRMAAAQAGAQKILCYWGNLEVAKHDLSTKTITWLPVVDVIIPDQKDNVRVHLKLALVDVRTGAWSFFRTQPVQAQVITTGWAREHLEIPEVRELQQKSYVVAVNTLASVRQ